MVRRKVEQPAPGLPSTLQTDRQYKSVTGAIKDLQQNLAILDYTREVPNQWTAILWLFIGYPTFDSPFIDVLEGESPPQGSSHSLDLRVAIAFSPGRKGLEANTQVGSSLSSMELGRQELVKRRVRFRIPRVRMALLC